MAMLTHLSIRNIVLIEACEIALSGGLCVLTGETGAGKSILLDALGLVLGARSDSALVRAGADAGAVTAEFDISGNAAAAGALEALGLEKSEALIIRRTLSADGKTRCFVNDAPVGVAALRSLGETLVEINGQHDSHGLLDASTHRALLDAYGAHGQLAEDVRAHYAAWKQAEAALSDLQAALAEGAREEEFLRHMVGELQALDPRPGEEESLAEQRTRMMQSEKLFETLREAQASLNEGKGVAGALHAAQRVLARSGLNADNRFASVIDLLEKAAEAGEEAAQALEAMGRAAPYDQQKLEAIEERLFALKALARKYHLSVDELPGLRDEAAAKLAKIAGREAELRALAQGARAAKDAFISVAERLSARRVAEAKRLERGVEAELEPLKMGGARFRVGIVPLAESLWSAHGLEAVAFEAATNVAKKSAAVFAPLAKIASGGELSRFMLALKVAMRALRSTPTLIFDEIDTGTGGAVADAIGARLAELGGSAQVLVVTHLAQVAARGQQHLLIAKTQGKKVETSVAALSAEARKEELARMLAGSVITQEARRAAQKLLEQAA